MIYKVGMLCKHFKGKTLLEKNIYRIIKLDAKASELNDEVTYTGDSDFITAEGLVVYANIFQDNKLFAREYSDISSPLSSEKQLEFSQEIKVQPLTEEETSIVMSDEFKEEKKILTEKKFATQKVKK